MGDITRHVVKQGFKKKRPKVDGVDTTKMTTEQRAKWQSLVLTLTRYGTSRRFGDQLRSFGFILTAASLRKHTIEELEDLLDRARVCCQQATVEGMFSQAALSAVGFAESAVANTPGLKDKILLSGLTESLKQDEGFMAALEQMSIDYGSFISCPPEYRLLMAFTAAAGRTHAINLFVRKRAEMIAAASQEGETLKTKTMLNEEKGDAEELHFDAKKVTGAEVEKKGHRCTSEKTKKVTGAQVKKTKKGHRCTSETNLKRSNSFLLAAKRKGRQP